MKKVHLFPLALLVLTLTATSALHAQVYSVLYNFGTQDFDPLYPVNSGIITQGQDGSLYSTTPNGRRY